MMSTCHVSVYPKTRERETNSIMNLCEWKDLLMMSLTCYLTWNFTASRFRIFSLVIRICLYFECNTSSSSFLAWLLFPFFGSYFLRFSGRTFSLFFLFLLLSFLPREVHPNTGHSSPKHFELNEWAKWRRNRQWGNQVSCFVSVKLFSSLAFCSDHLMPSILLSAHFMRILFDFYLIPAALVVASLHEREKRSHVLVFPGLLPSFFPYCHVLWPQVLSVPRECGCCICMVVSTRGSYGCHDRRIEEVVTGVEYFNLVMMGKEVNMMRMRRWSGCPRGSCRWRSCNSCQSWLRYRLTVQVVMMIMLLLMIVMLMQMRS